MRPERARLSRFEWACLALVVFALTTRLLVFHFRQAHWDSMWYLTMGKSLVENREFVAPWIEGSPHTQHFPPAYPALAALAYAVGNGSFGAYATVAVLVSAFLAAVTFLTTWNLYGRARAFAATAIVSTSTVLAELDLQLLSESLVVAFFALTIWGILRSLDDPRFILAAGLFAGMGYLTKASMGPFFLLAGAGGFAWRFYYVRWRVLRDKWYVGAGAIFGVIVLLWAWRNVRWHGWPNWETQPHANEAVRHLFAQPSWPLVLGGTFLWGGVILLAFALAFLPEIRASLRRIREERTSALWLAVVTPSVIGLVFAAAFSSLEGKAIVTDTPIRYLVTPIVPLVWLGVREMPFGDDAPAGAPTHGRSLLRGRLAWLAAGAGLLAFLHFANPTYPLVSDARIWIYVLGSALGVAFLLIARVYAWRPSARAVAGGGVSWRAERAPLAGPPAWLALAAFAFAVAIGILVAQAFFTLLVPIAGSLAAGSARARVIALAFVAVMVPLAGVHAEVALVDATGDLNALAAPGDVVAAPANREHYVYPFLRQDVDITTPDRPHDWLLVLNEWGDVGDPGPDYSEARAYTVRYGAGPGAWVGLRFWTAVLGDDVEMPSYTTVKLHRRVADA